MADPALMLLARMVRTDDEFRTHTQSCMVHADDCGTCRLLASRQSDEFLEAEAMVARAKERTRG